MSFKLKSLFVVIALLTVVVISVHTVAQTGGTPDQTNDLNNPNRHCCPDGTTSRYRRTISFPSGETAQQKICCTAGSGVDLKSKFADVDKRCCADAGGDYFEGADGEKVCCNPGSVKSLDTGLVNPVCCANRGGKMRPDGRCCRCKTPDCPPKTDFEPKA